MSDQAAKTAAQESSEHLQELVGVVSTGRKIAITCSNFDISRVSSTVKTVHFIRHGQGYHNLLADLMRKGGAQFGCVGGEDESISPYKMPEIVDPPLTELGRQQAAGLQKRALDLSPSLIVVSPLSRATKTALIAFEHVVGEVPIIAHEDTREKIGVHTCDKRHSVREAKVEYPTVDYSLLHSDADVLWSADKRESSQEVSDRAYSFMEWLRTRPEEEVVVATHSGWLLTLFNTVLTCDCEDLKTWFATGEMRSVLVSYSDIGVKGQKRKQGE